MAAFDFSIRTKLAVWAGIGVALVGGMVGNQQFGDRWAEAQRRSAESRQLAAVQALRASDNARSMEIEAREIRLAIAPGEIVSITGQTVGPAPLVSGALPLTGSLGTTLGTTIVTFNNLPAPVLYTSGTLTNVIVPYGVAGSTSASVVLKTGTQTTAAFTIPVTASVPGVFATNDGGTGQAVVLNQDGTVNTTANPAAKGAVVVLFATGEGAVNPAGQDGLVISTDLLHEPLLPVALTIGGISAQVLYAGSAPGSVAGIMEVEAIVPASAASGSDAVLLTVGTASSQTNVTLSVK